MIRWLVLSMGIFDLWNRAVLADIHTNEIFPSFKTYGYYLNQGPLYENLDNSDEPLILTPLIKAGKLDEARCRSKVHNISVVPSYSGFFNVNQDCNSNLFFWYFPAAYNADNAPVVIWLQGGPGGSSLFGLFVENGPFSIDKVGDINLRPTSWAIPYHVIYIDQPVGTGFSFTEKDSCYAKDQTDVAKDLFEAVQQFYTLFPNLRKNELYITGESYAGKYVPAISYKIHKENSMTVRDQDKIPLAGLAIGDGLSDPINQFDFSDFLYDTGFVDDMDRKSLEELAKKARLSIETEQWRKAADFFNEAMDIFENKTGLRFYFNYLISQQPDDFNYFIKFLEQPEVRKAIHVGNAKYDVESAIVSEKMYEDLPKTVKPWIEELLNADYKVMIYNGQLDVIVAYPLTEKYIRSLKWKHAKDYAKATRGQWKVGKEIAGYAREVGNFRQIMVRNAGHILPYDQPKWAFDLIRRFVDGIPFVA